MSLFSSLNDGPTVNTVTEPQKIFHALPSKAAKYEYLRDVQGDVLAKWHDNRDRPDNVIKMNTGGGKTVVGLLALKSCLNAGTGPAVYVCPDHYLCDQVISEAKQLGIDTVEDPRSPHYLSGRAILVIPVQTLFNGRSKFGVGSEGVKIPIGAVVIDDAHACLNIAEKQFTVTVPRPNPIYDALLALFLPVLRNQSITSAAEIERGDPRALMHIPYWDWAEKLPKIAEILVANSDNEAIEWQWPLLRAVLSPCQCYISARQLEIAPRCLPIEAIPSFTQAKHRIYMTATLADDSILVTDFNANPEAIAAPLSPKSGSDIGERLILVPQEINTNLTDENIRAFVSTYSKDNNVVVIVPSFERAKFWSSVATATVSADNIQEGVDKLRGSVGNLLVMVNRYDGVDLPNDACRILVVDGLPDSRRMIDRYEQSALESSDRYRGRQVQRIEQGMGRGIRASQDYCVVILMGSQLLGTLYANGAVDFFSSSTKKQLALSRRLARLIEEKGLPEMAKAIGGVLSRDPEWVGAAKNALIEVTNPSHVAVDPIAIAQREAFEASKRGQYEKAEAALRKPLETASNDAVEGWLLEQIAEAVNQLDKVRSQSILARAHEKNMTTARPLKGIAYPKVDTAGLDQAGQSVEFLKATYKDKNSMVLGVNALLDRLSFGPDTAEVFEQSLYELGHHLGFKSQRPEKLGISGLDVMWGIGERIYLLLPCKSECVVPTISKTYADQVSGSAAWFKGAYDHTCTAIPAIVHPSQVMDKLGAVPDGTKVINLDKFDKLKTAVKNYILSMKDHMDDLNHVRTALVAEQLLGSQIVSAHTVPIKKAFS